MEWKEILRKNMKPDYIDIDGDGDKKEPMKDAVEDKGEKKAEPNADMPDYRNMDARTAWQTAKERALQRDETGEVARIIERAKQGGTQNE